MDPYLEAPDIWPDLHDALAGGIKAVLNQSLPAPYYARVESRPEVGIAEEEGAVRRIIPDVAVARHPRPQVGARATAVLDAPRAGLSKSYELTIPSESLRHTYVEIRDPSRGHHLVTLIEIASPNCKRTGPDREAYFQKQREVLESDAHLIEIDLLRGGRRVLFSRELEQFIAQIVPRPDYVVLVNRAWRRAERSQGFEIFPAVLTEPLPVFPVPLREGQAQVPLDLQFVFNRAYDEGGYLRGAVDYTELPRPPLPAELAEWGRECVRAAGLAGGDAATRRPEGDG
jgi:hypothetical protein